ncbi:MAG: hypothetical protein ABIG45_06980, partial [Bacillota bacterium]
YVLDKIVYLIRWRPRPIWLRRHAKRKRYDPQPQEDYGFPEYDADAPVITVDDYDPASEYPYADAAPTVQYQIQSQQAPPLYEDRPADLPYTTPFFAPEAAHNAYHSGEAPPRWDEETQGQPFAPAAPAAPVTDSRQRFAFGMAPSFGSAQSEPAYSYHRDAAPSFAPPQYAQDFRPEEAFAPPIVDDPYMEETEDVPPPAFQQPSPFFRPFSDRGADTYSPSKTKGLGAVAKKARNLLNADEAYESLTYQDIQPTVDVSKAFHSPVYPEKKPEGDA